MKYILFFLLSGFMLLGCRSGSQLPDMRENYSYKNTEPFGSKVAYLMLEKNYEDNYIDPIKESFQNASKWWGDKEALYVCISNKFYTDKKDAGDLLNFAKKGNTVFISSNTIDENLLSQLYLESNETSITGGNKPRYEQTATGINFMEEELPAYYSYFYHPFENYYKNIKSVYKKSLGAAKNNEQPNLLIIYWGKGKIILHAEPKALSNYFLLTNDNFNYFSNIMKLFPESPEHIYWDDYYHNIDYRDDDGSFSTLATIFQYPALKWAFLLGFWLLIFYILINRKRRQRIIPVIPETKNSSIAFAQAIAGLYLKENDNKAISKKMITYFNEGIRSRYFLNSSQPNENYLQTLSSKSGLELSKIKELYHSINMALQAYMVTDDELLKLNEQIQFFYKNRN